MRLLFVLLIGLMPGNEPALNYKEALAPDYHRAIQYFKDHREKFMHCLSGNEQEKTLMISVVFPEIVRYSKVRDLLETKSLEIGYVRKGKKYVDFSIGRFQMKPSFVETLEDYIRKNPELTAKYSSIPEYPIRNVVSIRRERIKRLKNLRWQLRYLQAFFDVVNNEFPFLQEMGLSYRVRYYATAYNYSFHASPQEIEQWMDYENYPYGTDMLGRQYAYSEVSLYFFRNHVNKIFKSKN